MVLGPPRPLLATFAQNRTECQAWSGGSRQNGSPATTGSRVGRGRPDDPRPRDGGQPAVGAGLAGAGRGRRPGGFLGRGGPPGQGPCCPARPAGPPVGG